MLIPMRLFLLSLIPVTFAGCGGGGGGSNSNAGNGHGNVLPPTPQGAGVAGLMHGRYVVTSIEVVPDANNSNPNPSGATLAVGSIFDFDNGTVLTINGDDPHDAGGSVGGGFPANEFYSNGPTGNVTTFCVGATFPPTFLGGGFLRLGMVSGTTSATAAIAESIEWYQFATPPVASWGHYRAVLVKQ